MRPLYIGLMSGTSLDGVDGALVEFGDGPSPDVRVVAHAYRDFDATLRAEMLALNSPGDNELHRASLAANALARRYAAVVEDLLNKGSVGPDAVRAIGAHGQTVRHRPHEFDGTGYTIQVNNPSLIAELTGIPVVADFRSRDVAAGGHGAPLAPGLHAALYAQADASVAVLNIGGISNVTLLRPGRPTIGFDCGPGNVLMDLWVDRHRHQRYDANGDWAASGNVLPDLLAALMAEPYLALPPPKSTGRDLFDARWLDAAVARAGPAHAEDVQATLCEFTARAVAQSVHRHAEETRTLLVCGGGAYNADLLRRLSAALPGTIVEPTDARGLPATHVEAVAFAWLARTHVERTAGNLPSVTGASGDRILGAFHPAKT